MANYYTGSNNLCQLILLTEQNHSIFSNNKNRFSNKVYPVAETTAELCVAGTRKTPAYNSSPAHHLTVASNTRRSNVFPTNRIQPYSNQTYDTHLPSIRDTNGNDELRSRSRSRSKTPIANNSPKTTDRPPSASMSSIFNTFAKRSTENFMNMHNGMEETTNSNLVPPSRRSQRPNRANDINQSSTKQTIVPQKQSGDSGIDIRFSSSSGDTNQQQRALGVSSKNRTNTPQIHTESPLVHETVTKERTNHGQLYQRRQNNAIKTPIKQKIDKYRRRSEEAIQATNGGILMNTANNNVPATTPTLAPTTSARSKVASPFSSAVRRVSSDAEVQARLEVLRLSMETNLITADQEPQNPSHQYSRNRVKSPYLYTNHQQITPTASTSNTQTPPSRLRRKPGCIQPISPANSSQHQYSNTQNNRRSQQQQPHSFKQSINTNQKNLYLAFIASRHLSALDDPLFECDIDHQKLLRIFTWLKGVEEYRHEQLDHEQLLIGQNQRMLDEEENLSLYSEIQHAVDDLPANTTGKPCEKIAPMQFED